MATTNTDPKKTLTEAATEKAGWLTPDRKSLLKKVAVVAAVVVVIYLVYRYAKR